MARAHPGETNAVNSPQNPELYEGNLWLDALGDWQVTLDIDSPAGPAAYTFDVRAREGGGFNLMFVIVAVAAALVVATLFWSQLQRRRRITAGAAVGCVLQSDGQAEEYIERALGRWRATGGQNLTAHAEFQITRGRHQDVQREWIGLALENHYARQLQNENGVVSAACWGEILAVRRVLKVIVNPDGLVITAHFDRGALGRLLRARRQTPE